MPRISSYTPAWLSRPSPGFDFFNKTPSSPSKPLHGSTSINQTNGPSRTVARRGTEIFAVVGNELRWSDLGLLKERWESQRRSDRHTQADARSRASAPSSHGLADDNSQQPPYRVLKASVSRKIHQIVMSPAQDYLAIITSHTAHIALLPDPSHLFSHDMSDLKLKTFQLGPTIHVMERSPIATALWHPLAFQGAAFVTITVDAIVRLWELDSKNRWSFDMPPLEFDLKKLADAQSAAEDFSPSKYGTNKSFSPDSFEMEVASASFGGEGQEGESLWSAMTLWVAMKAGDIYALCPLLPSKWQAPSSLISSLSASLQCRAASFASKENVSKAERKLCDQQLNWITEIEKHARLHGDTVLHRPVYPSSIPKLQGPFQLAPDPDQVFDITDIYTMRPTPAEESQPDADTAADPLSLSFDLVCVATSDGKIHICAALDPVEGSWLPSKKSSRLLADEPSIEQDAELLVVESISLTSSSKTSWPIITSDVQSQNSIFVTHDCGVSHVNLAPLVDSLLDELNDQTDSGVDFRMEMLVENSRCQVDHPIAFQKRPTRDESLSADIATCIDLLDSELGHFLLTVVAGQAYAVTLDDLEVDRLANGVASDYAAEAEIHGLLTNESRPSYQPPAEFWSDSTLTSFIEQHVHSRGRRFMGDEIRFSPTTLNLLMEAHRVLSHETHRLGVAAADLFSRCERLQDEFREQITRARDVAERVDAVLGDDADPYEANQSALADGSTPEVIEERLEAVKARQEDLTARYDELRRKVGSIKGRSLNEKEKVWANEVAAIDELVWAPSAMGAEESRGLDNGDGVTQPMARFDNIKRLKEQMVAQAQELDETAAGAGRDRAAASEAEVPDVFSIAPDRRRARLAEINGMLDRQTALVEATRAKLERLDASAL